MVGLEMACFGGVLWLSAAAASPPITVRGDTTCPTARDVEAELVGMISSREATATSNVVELAGGRSVTVRLLKASGQTIAEKLLPEARSCPERARAAAVIVAAWEVRLRGGAEPMLPVLPTSPTSPPSPPPPLSPTPLSPTPPLSPPTPPRAMALPPPPQRLQPVAPNSIAAAEPSGGLTARPPVPPPAPSPPSAISLASPSSPPSPPPPSPSPSTPPPPLARSNESGGDVVASSQARPRDPITFETGAALLTSVVAKELAVGGAIEARVSRRDSGVAVGAGAFVVDAHSMSVGGGQGRWRRFGGIVDLRSTARWRVMEMEMRAGLALTALSVGGQALPMTSATTLLDAGGIAGLRARFPLGRLTAWIDATGAVWPNTNALYVTGTTSSAQIPTFEILVGVGVSLMVIR